ncbi:uncharacterized protein LOC135226750 [Macrobrachium nipponense]|uniref:uncharacterized protein LOC135226750 n=1 Tax=Macrobrachium nipponense TaxID=159736 RepID=UPI0030C8C725
MNYLRTQNLLISTHVPTNVQAFLSGRVKSWHRDLQAFQHERLIIPHKMVSTLITGGRLSYLDCRIRLYDAADVKKCSALRRKGQDGPLWMAFYGDSKVRDKFAMFLEKTPNFNWYIYNNTLKEKTSTTWKAYNLIHGYKMQHSLSVAGDQDAKLDFIWAPRGFEIYNKSAPRGNELEFWAYKAPRVPSVVVVGFGSWSMSSGATTDSETLNKYSDYADVWRSMAKVLSVLAARTNVLAWAQSRSRDYVVVSRVNAASMNQEPGSKKHEKAALIQKLTRLLHYTRLFSSTAEWTDEVMHMALRNTGVTIWDSTMPMNLLNIQECQVLHDSRMTAYLTYFDHSCQDDIHSDSYTVEDENMMLINLLCNQYVGKVEGTYCCTK